MLKNSTDFLKIGKYLGKLYTKMFEDIRAEYSITQVELDVLAFLHNHPQHNTAKDICEIRMITKSNVSVAIDSLCAKEYVTVLPDSQDRRISRLQLTEKSAPAVNEIFAMQESYVKAVFADIPPEEIDSFIKTLIAIDQNISNKMEALENER